MLISFFTSLKTSYVSFKCDKIDYYNFFVNFKMSPFKSYFIFNTIIISIILSLNKNSYSYEIQEQSKYYELLTCWWAVNSIVFIKYSYTK